MYIHVYVSHYTCIEERGKGKGPVESEGFMNALSSQAAKMKEKKRKVSKVNPTQLLLPLPLYIITYTSYSYMYVHTS